MPKNLVLSKSIEWIFLRHTMPWLDTGRRTDFFENVKNSTKKHASRASALRADIARGIAGLLVTYPVDPTH